MSYNPPSTRSENKDEHPVILNSYDIAYNLGYEAANDGRKNHDDNPYKPSGYERDETYADKLNYQWYLGFSDFELQ